MEKLESELAVKSSNIRNLKVDVADPSVLNRLKGEGDVRISWTFEFSTYRVRFTFHATKLLQYSQIFGHL